MKFVEHNAGGVSFLAADGMEGALHGFSTRRGGVSSGIYSSLNLGLNRGDDPANVRENFRRFCAAVGADASRMVFSRQIHGDAVRACTAADAGIGLDREIPYEADGLITDVPGLPLVIFTADCIPILLFDPVRRAVGTVHAGWRGTALGIAAKAAEKMSTCYGCDPADLRAAIGPGISKCCFETDEDVPNAMTAALGAAALPFLESLPGGKYRVDLKGINHLWLERAGLRAEHIAVSGDCTVCRSETYWSHRVTHGQRGSQAAIIALRD